MLRLVRDVAGAVSADPRVGLPSLNRQLVRLGWDGIKIDAATFKLLTESFHAAGSGGPPRVPAGDAEGLRALLDTIYDARGFDFRGYAKTSIARRLRRRLDARGCRSYADYQTVLREDPAEYDRLFDEVTINVTSFFRNRAAFRALEQAIAALLALSDKRPFRIWSAGCATGEEAYSLSMLLQRLLPEAAPEEATVLATDIDATAIERARQGTYDPATVEALPERWVRRFFRPAGAGYRPRSAVRARVRFEQHNLVADPPPQGLDVVVCRNVLIYFTLPLQMKVIEKLHRGLEDGGYLLIGRYEMLLREARRLFECVDFDSRLYRKKGGGTATPEGTPR